MAAIVQAFEISPEIQLGVSQGLYKVWGGVVRWAVGDKKGQIVTHLKPIELERVTRINPTLIKKVGTFVENHKKETLISGAVALVTMSGARIYFNKKNKKSKEELAFRLALNAYIDSVRSGELNTDKIDELVNSMEILKRRKDFSKIKLDITTRDFELLINRMHKYTIKLAQDNDIDLLPEEMEAMGEDTIISFQRFLNAQKRILEQAA